MPDIPNQVQEFIDKSAPFDTLNADKRSELSANFRQFYCTQENKETFLSRYTGALFLVQSGQFVVSMDDDKTQRFLSAGDYFGFHSGLQQKLLHYQVKVETPGLVFCLAYEDFVALLETQPKITRFFRGLVDNNLQHQEISAQNSVWLYTSIASLLKKKLVAAEHNTSISTAAREMRDKDVSSILVTQDKKLAGIVTDRDLRSRALAEELSFDTPISTIMSPAPISIKASKTLFDALSLMAANNIHHLPVVDPEDMQAIGMLTASDMLKQQRSNILYLIHELGKCPDKKSLIQVARKIRDYFSQHARKVGDFDIAGKILAQATDLMTNKLITFYQQRNGEEPLSYCWLAFGSQAREDQNLASDQDNALLLARQPRQDEADYFASLAEYVCRGLDQCGIALCKGNIMATNPALRMSVEGSIDQAKAWVEAPTPKAIMHFNIFLDVRAVAGDGALLKQVHAARAPLFTRSIFLAALTRHMNQANVPLSIFGKFSTGGSEVPKGCIDLKTQGVNIINELVRIYALENEIQLPSTIRRLKKLRKLHVLNDKDGTNLEEIWLFINRLRWRHQLEQDASDNFVAVERLSSLEKHQLKNAFEIIKRAQQTAVMKFSGGLAS